MGLRYGWMTLALWAGVCFGQAAAPTFHLSGKVIGGSGEHAIHVALWGAAGFLQKPVQEIVIEPGAATDFHFDVRGGLWALSAFEDENDNGKLDMGMFGPKEPSGFWRPFHAWRKPRFDDVETEVGKDVEGIEIRVK